MNKFNYEQAKQYSEKYSIPLEDVLLIAINRYGVVANIEDKRLRFKISVLDYPDSFYLAVCVNTYESPFILIDNQIVLQDVVIGNVYDIEKDTCDATYFRREKTELTLNSNMRSTCKGCSFCGTYNMDPKDRVDLSSDSKVEKYVSNILEANDMKDLSKLSGITICTGCFVSEDELVDHIIKTYRVFEKFSFTNRIRYIGSQIRSIEAMEKINRAIPSFAISLTIECFSKREMRLRKEKGNLNIDGIKKVLNLSLNFGFETNYLYIVGLDKLRVFEEGVDGLKPYINRMPIFQIMQNYYPEHELERELEARSFDYYLKARQIIEAVFSSTQYKPQSWENYRGLFYTKYKGEEYKCIRI